MEQWVSDKLYSQCLQRVWLHFAGQNRSVAIKQAKVACVCRSASFRGASNALSLESSLSGEQSSLILGEVLPDDRAEREFGVVDTWLMMF